MGVHTEPNSCPGKSHSHGGQYPSLHQLHSSPVLQITQYPPSARTATQPPTSPWPLANTVPKEPAACNGRTASKAKSPEGPSPPKGKCQEGRRSLSPRGVSNGLSVPQPKGPDEEPRTTANYRDQS